MDRQSSWAKKAGVTRGKLVLIGLLAAVLVGVLYWQFGRDGAETRVSATGTSRRHLSAARDGKSKQAEQPGAVTSATGSTNRETARPLSSKWKPPEISRVIQYDPFALPASFPQPLVGSGTELAQTAEQDGKSADDRRAELEKELHDIRAELETLRHQGVHVIIQRKDEYVAMIGDRTIHVGDELNGFKVIGIDSNGVQIVRELDQ